MTRWRICGCASSPAKEIAHPARRQFHGGIRACPQREELAFPDRRQRKWGRWVASSRWESGAGETGSAASMKKQGTVEDPWSQSCLGRPGKSRFSLPRWLPCGLLEEGELRE